RGARVVRDADAARGDRPDRQLRAARIAQPAQDEVAEIRLERVGDLVGDGHAAARRAEEDDGLPFEPGRLPREAAYGLPTSANQRRPHLHWGNECKRDARAMGGLTPRPAVVHFVAWPAPCAPPASRPAPTASTPSPDPARPGRRAHV